MFFGSALTNFGVEAFLDAFLELAPPPRRAGATGRAVPPDAPRFTGFVFKIQANMDRAHRDRIAFVRVCSGRFERGMKVHHVRTGKKLRLAKPQQFLAQRAQDRRGGLAGRRHRPVRPRRPPHRRHALRAARRSASRASRASRPSTSPALELADPTEAQAARQGARAAREEGTIQLFIGRRLGAPAS